MAYIEWNPNPVGRKVDDCAIRAVAKALGMGWETAAIVLAINSIQMGSTQTAKEVVGATLRQHGFKRTAVPDSCPDCYTVKDFCEDNPEGLFVVGSGSHIVVAEDGNYFDAWDSGDETALFVWYEAVEPRFN